MRGIVNKSIYGASKWLSKNFDYIDGNAATSEIAYKLCEQLIVFPITPSTGASNQVEKWETEEIQNIFGNTPRISQMQSESGSISSVHGSLVTGGLVSTFTSSQGLLLMTPTLFQIAGQLHPFVLHVASRSVATNSTSIGEDHSDVMSIRGTGFSFISSRSPQECYDKAIISHIASLKTRIPICHFYDGGQVSNQVNVVEKIDDETLKSMIPYKEIREHKERALNPTHPTRIGCSIGSNNYQLNESIVPYYEKAFGIIEGVFEDYSKIVGRKYNPIEYVGSPNAKKVIVCMGSSSIDVESVVHRINSELDGEVGCISIHLFRPWNPEYFISRLPKSVEHIAVLDRTRELGALGEPLYLDVAATLKEVNSTISLTHGRYGLGGAYTKPDDIKAVFDNMGAKDEKKYFILGIKDDVLNRNLEPKELLPREENDEKISSIFYGTGGDGTISGVQNSVSVYKKFTDKLCQTMNRNTPHKSGAITISDLRCSNEIITDSHPILNDANVIVCAQESYVNKIPMIKKLKNGGSFILNIGFDEKNVLQSLDELLPNSIKRMIAEKEVNFYVVNADKIAMESGIPKRKNNILMSIYFQVLGELSPEKIREVFYEIIETSYGNKGEDLVKSNKEAVDRSFDSWVKVDYPEDWMDLDDETETINRSEETEFIQNIQVPFQENREQEVEVSKFLETGSSPLGTSKYEKRGVALRLPEWEKDKCIQCNKCVFNCPHSVIRNFLLDDISDEVFPDKIPLAKPHEKEGRDFTIQISSYDCTGCFACVNVCPVGALVPGEYNKEIAKKKDEKFQFCMSNNVNNEFKSRKIDIKSAMYRPTYFEYSGACAGCVESTNIKILTQLFGDRMIIANASGCTTVFSSYYMSSPYTVNENGMGPAWGRSLFENAAEFGYGMKLTTQVNRENLVKNVKKLLDDKYIEENSINDDLVENLKNWLIDKDDGEKTIEYYKKIKDILDRDYPFNSIKIDSPLYNLKLESDLIVKPSHFVIGGDGWAYDIGYGGLDHVLSTGENITILVLDNELYANTGGQLSKSSPLSFHGKLSTKGKRRPKKKLWEMALTYSDVYVATIATNYDPNHTLKVFQEAESYPGSSLVIAFCPCLVHDDSTNLGESRKETETIAVESGYFPLFSFNPQLLHKGENPLKLRTKTIKRPVTEYLMGEKRFRNLEKNDNEMAAKLQQELQDDVNERFDRLKHLEKRDYGNTNVKT